MQLLISYISTSQFNLKKSYERKKLDHIFVSVKQCNETENSRSPPKIRLGSLLNVHTKFHFPSSIWWRDRGGIALYQGQKREETLISLFLSDVGDWIFVLCNIEFSIDWFKKKQFLPFVPLAPSPPNLGTSEFWLKLIPTYTYIIRRFNWVNDVSVWKKTDQKTKY